MHLTKNNIDAFFDAYAQRFNNALAGEPYDIEGTVNAFSESFIEASPLGVNCGRNDEEFREAIPKGLAYYRSIGTQSMKIMSKDITPLDEHHTMVKIHWLSTYLKQNKHKEVIESDVIYFLQAVREEIRIFAYITGDEQKVLQERGLISE